MVDELFSLGYSRLATISKSWVTVGNISAQGTTLAEDGRAWSDVKSYFVGTQTTYLGYPVPQTINAGDFRFQTTADGDNHVVEVWGCRVIGDHLTLLATLTIKGGSQEGDDSLYFVDTITATTENLFHDGRVMDSGNNRICRYAVDLNGYHQLLFIATTLASSSTLRVQMSGW